MVPTEYRSIKSVEREVGILIREVFGLVQGLDFLRIACYPNYSDQDLPPIMVATWCDSKKHSQRMLSREQRKGVSLFYGRKQQKGVSFFHGQYEGLAQRSYRLHLFKFDLSRPFDFLVSDLHLPVEIVGCVWIVDIPSLLSFQQSHGPLFENLKDLKDKGEIGWAREQKLSSVFATTGSEISTLSAEEVCSIFALDSQTPVIPCPSKIGSGCVERVLSALVDRIEAERSL